MAIRIRMDAALKVLDGFTGRPPAPSALRCFVDGALCRPIVKEDGYYVLTGLGAGQHQVVLRGAHYVDETVTVTGGSGQELLVTMKPGRGYPFGGAVTWLTVNLQPGGKVWIAAKNPLLELKIAQDAWRAGETEGRLFYRQPAKALSLPRDFLLLDGPRTEICRVEELEEGRLAAPTAHDHKRGCCLYPAQEYTADGAGLIRAVFREPMPVELLPEGGRKTASLELRAGDNECTLSVK